MNLSPELRRLAVLAYLKRLSLDDKPILIGPWRSEVGFEAMYWLPFLSWCAKRVPGFWNRAVVVTRGGAGELYQRYQDVTVMERHPELWPDGDVISTGTAVIRQGDTMRLPIPLKSVDLYTLRSVTEVRRENLYDWSRTKLQKQTRCTKWDEQVLNEAAGRLTPENIHVQASHHWHISPRVNLKAYHILHPSWMYWALQPFWGEDRGLKYLLSMTDYTPLPRLVLPVVAVEGEWPASWQLPKKFVALKFYGRATFPWPHAETARFVSEITGILAAQTDVVLLDSGHSGDDHGDIPLEGPRIHRLPAVPPEQNLALQAAVLGQATAFIGTYGGMAQLALRMGVPSVSFYTEFGQTAHAHLSLSSYLSKAMRVPFLAGSIADAELWRQVVSLPATVTA